MGPDPNFAGHANYPQHLGVYPCRGRASLLRLFTELRQACCHPQIVRRNDNVLGNERLGMSDIMRKLSQKAYLEYDNALRIYIQACLVKAGCVDESICLAK